MQALKQRQSWKVSIQARAKNFNFKLKATQILPTGKFHRFALLLRLHKCILKFQLKSGSTVSISTERKRTLKSTILSLLENLRLRPKKTLTVQHPDVRSALNRLKQCGIKKSICGSSLVTAILALLMQSISKKDRKEIITHTSIVLMCWILHFNRHGKGKTSSFWMVLIVGTAACWAALQLSKGYVSEFASNHAAYSGCWCAACQVVFALVKIFHSHIHKLKEKWF